MRKRLVKPTKKKATIPAKRVVLYSAEGRFLSGKISW